MKKPYEHKFDRISMFNALECCRRDFSMKCQVPGCDEVACSSHSISKSFILKAFDGDSVYMPLRSIKDSSRIKIERVGKNKSTIFNCICNNHDTIIFCKLDVPCIQVDDESLFLLNFRCFYQFYFKINREIFSQEKLSNKYDIEDNMKIEVSNTWLNYCLSDVEKIKQSFDKCLNEKIYTEYQYYITKLNYKVEFSVSSAMCFKYDIDGKVIEYSEDFTTIYYLNILPQDNETLIIVSFLIKDKIAASFVENTLIKLPEEELLKYLDFSICFDVENYVVSEKLFKAWGKDGQQEIDGMNLMRYHYETILTEEMIRCLISSHKKYSFFMNLNS